MLPLQDVMPSHRPPAVTLTLIGLSAIALGYQFSLSPGSRLSHAFAFGLVPASASAWSFATALVIQPDLVAGAVNLLALWIFGDNLEDRLGHGRFLVCFAVGGLVASMAAVGLDPGARTALPAASGAVAAVIGGHVGLFPRSQILVLAPWFSLDLVEVPALVIVAGWLLVHGMRYAGTWMVPASLAGSLVIPLVGFAAGALAARILRRPERMSAEWWSGLER